LDITVTFSSVAVLISRCSFAECEAVRNHDRPGRICDRQRACHIGSIPDTVRMSETGVAEATAYRHVSK
jgi:hypothetical protein